MTNTPTPPKLLDREPSEAIPPGSDALLKHISDRNPLCINCSRPMGDHRGLRCPKQPATYQRPVIDHATTMSAWIERDMRVGDRLFPAGTVTIVDILDHAARLAASPPHDVRAFPEAADGRETLPMEAEIWAAGADLETAKFVARVLGDRGYRLIGGPDQPPVDGDVRERVMAIDPYIEPLPHKQGWRVTHVGGSSTWKSETAALTCLVEAWQMRATAILPSHSEAIEQAARVAEAYRDSGFVREGLVWQGIESASSQIAARIRALSSTTSGGEDGG